MRTRSILLCLLASPALAQSVLDLDGGVPDDAARYFEVPFTVPEGTQEIEVRHDDLSGSNILDWGLEEPDGRFRGWGGGNEEPAIAGVNASSRSYLTGPIPAGEWKVVVGKAKIVSRPAVYDLRITLRNTPTLAPQPERRPYVASPPLETGGRWYTGDFHVHSRESGDARPSLDELATFARARGMDFVVLTDHNTTSHLDFIGDAQGRHPELLLIPGMEYTTYAGHANAIGSTVFVDSRLSYVGKTIDQAVDEFHADGALFSINHPLIDLPMEMCIGCAWELPVPQTVDAVEVGTSGWSTMGMFFSEPAIAFWDALSARGIHAKALGGSDDHRAGVGLNNTQSPIGDPTTLVWAEELSVAGILQGIRDGRTVVKLMGPDDPMLELDAAGRVGDTVIGESAHLVARVEGGVGHDLRFVKNGRPQAAIHIDSDPFVLEEHVMAQDTADRWRAEVLVGGRPRTLTSNLWVQKTAGAAPSPNEAVLDEVNACGCATTPVAPLVLAALGLLALRARRARPAAAPAPAPRAPTARG